MHLSESPRLIHPHNSWDVIGLDLYIGRVLRSDGRHHIEDWLGPLFTYGIIGVNLVGALLLGKSGVKKLWDLIKEDKTLRVRELLYLWVLVQELLEDVIWHYWNNERALRNIEFCGYLFSEISNSLTLSKINMTTMIGIALYDIVLYIEEGILLLLSRNWER